MYNLITHLKNRGKKMEKSEKRFEISNDRAPDLGKKSIEKSNRYRLDPYFVEYNTEEEKYEQFSFICIDNLE